MRFHVAGLSVCLGLLTGGAAPAFAQSPDAAFEGRVRASEKFAAAHAALYGRETRSLVKAGVAAHGRGAGVSDVFAQWVEALRPPADAAAILDAVAKARGNRPLGRDDAPAWENLWKAWQRKWSAAWGKLADDADAHGNAPDWAIRFARIAISRNESWRRLWEEMTHPDAATRAGPKEPFVVNDWQQAWEADWKPFRVKSDAAVVYVREAIAWLEHGLLWTREHCGGTFSCRFQRPVKVFVFGSRASFTAEMKQFHKNRAANAADLWGFYSGRDQALHALLPDRDREGLRLVMQHEGVHAFLALGEPKGQHVIRKPGAMAMEAVAVWSEQFSVRRARWVVDRDAAGRLTALRQALVTGERPTLESLFALTEYQLRRRKAVELYAWAAAMAWFFCEHPEPKRRVRMREAFLEYLRRWYTVDDVKPVPTLVTLTKKPWPTLEKEWQVMLSKLAAKPK